MHQQHGILIPLVIHISLTKVKRRAAQFVKRDYRLTTSVSELIFKMAVIGRQSLEDCRKNAHLSLFYKVLHGLAAILVNELPTSYKVYLTLLN